MEVKQFIVSERQAGEKLQTFLQKELGLDWSTRKIKGLIDRNRCRVNGRLERYGCRELRRGDLVEFFFESTSLRLAKRWEDEHLIAYFKPPGLTHDQVCEQVEGTALHRLDRDTSGLLLFGKTEAVVQAMDLLFRDQQVKKRYVALVDGEMEGSGTTSGRIGRQKAETYWQVVRATQAASHLLLAPQTGRTHQLRIHLKRLGHPILGDGEYCRAFTCCEPVPRHMLHAQRLIFPHPITGEKVVLEEALPADFKKVMARLF
ncbi:MAG: RluA family pseudouridine synthase [Verrucomicrobia bacterium]|nr:RluA family pseudouridine synthase [Verrucomicrobiota bacterium]